VVLFGGVTLFDVAGHGGESEGMLRAVREMLTRLRPGAARGRRAQAQRLIALASLRREIIEDTLRLTGAEADLAAYAFEGRLRAALGAADLDAGRRHLLALGLFTVGARDGARLLLETMPETPPFITTQAMKFLLPLPRRVRALNDPGAGVAWLRKHAGRLRWVEGEERYGV
jgi:hypothetical protein